MSHDHDAAVGAARMFTAAIEKAMSSSRLTSGQSSGERNRARHEAVAQYMLDHILSQSGELEAFLREYEVRIKHQPRMWCEVTDSPTNSRFDHIIDDVDPRGLRDPVAVIEDKLDAPLSHGQLERYLRYLQGTGRKAALIVLHPRRNPLKDQKERLPEFSAKYPSVTVRFVTWAELCAAMIRRDPGGARAGLWAALEEFAESVGTGDLENLATTAVLADPEVAAEVRDIFLTSQAVAREIGSLRTRQLAFSFHGGNRAPWLQMGMSDRRHPGIGLTLDMEANPGALLVGERAPNGAGENYLESKIGFFREGALTPAARRRVNALSRLNQQIRVGESGFPSRIRGRKLGRQVSEPASDALALFGAIFQAQAIKNPHRGGASSSKTRGANEGRHNERIGAVLVREEGSDLTEVRLFIGPPDGQAWQRCTVWLRTVDGEREIAVKANEPGRDYVLRVWGEARQALES
ncbi:hypothetical protein [Brachybacterium endophyticum]|uniref:hypothetical protein n=1 Tax=Brachybacterium endophyticum TaxID=2182385 RepID=UPI0010583A93|nr:hypothetical protein [Brachybacterium endophyticum]